MRTLILACSTVLAFLGGLDRIVKQVRDFLCRRDGIVKQVFFIPGWAERYCEGRYLMFLVGLNVIVKQVRCVSE